LPAGVVAATYGHDSFLLLTSVEFFLAHAQKVLSPKAQQKGCFFYRAALICNLEVA